MNSTTEPVPQSDNSARSARFAWLTLIMGTGLCLTPVFACATPFAALAVLSALKLDRRDALMAMAVVWLANQAIGFGFLGYPITWDSAAWGLAIGVASGLAMLAARGLSTARPAPLAISLPFIAAFATFELGLYGAAFILPSSSAAFAPSVVWLVFQINAVALCALMAAYHLLMFVGSLVRHDPATYRTAGA